MMRSSLDGNLWRGGCSQSTILWGFGIALGVKHLQTARGDRPMRDGEAGVERGPRCVLVALPRSPTPRRPVTHGFCGIGTSNSHGPRMATTGFWKVIVTPLI